MDAITTEFYNKSPLKDLTNDQLFEMIYNSQHYWRFAQKKDGTVIEDRTAYKAEFQSCCLFFGKPENHHYFAHIMSKHAYAKPTYEDGVRELALEKMQS
jgi:ligand-binding SRPBCC domain-containing protein